MGRGEVRAQGGGDKGGGHQERRQEAGGQGLTMGEAATAKLCWLTAHQGVFPKHLTATDIHVSM